MTRQHITDEGPKPCNAATPDSCRVKRTDGKEIAHFDSTQEAVKAWEVEQAAAHGNTVSMSKSSEDSRLARFGDTPGMAARVVRKGKRSVNNLPPRKSKD